MTGEFDTDRDGRLREVLADFDGDDTSRDYVVEEWVYRLGFREVRGFSTREEATSFALRRARKTSRRWRVLGLILDRGIDGQDVHFL